MTDNNTVSGTAPEAGPTGTEIVDVAGLRANRDAILAEKKALAAELSKLKASAEAEKTKQLEEQQKYKELWETEKTAAQKLQAEYAAAAARLKLIQECSDIDPHYIDFAVQTGEPPDVLRQKYPAFFRQQQNQQQTLPNSSGKPPIIPQQAGYEAAISNIRNISPEELAENGEAHWKAIIAAANKR